MFDDDKRYGYYFVVFVLPWMFYNNKHAMH